MQILEDHPIAAMFPLMAEADIQEIADSITRNGQREPIVLFGGKILEGRNRYRACQRAGVQPVTRVYDPATDGVSVLQFVLDVNLHRRHLTAGQRAAISALAVQAMQKEAQDRLKAKESAPAGEPAPEVKAPVVSKGALMEDDSTVMNPDHGATVPAGSGTGEAAPIPTQEEQASTLGVSLRTVNTATGLAASNPSAALDVAQGKKTLNAAAEEEKKKKTTEEARKKVIDTIRKSCGEAFTQAFIDGDVLKTVAEVAAFMALDAGTQAKVAPLVATGWKTKRAAAHVLRKITNDSTVSDLINHAISENGTLVHRHGAYEITVQEIEGGSHTEPEAPAKEKTKKKA